MATSLFFYDLETTGFNPREARIMQFAGRRTDMQLRPVGDPHDILIRLSEDVVPEPDAILVTGITPQKTLADGVTEAEFLRIFQEEIATPGTIFVGYNTVRFDDEFMRYLHYRNFYDPYEWQWQDHRSRWDLLDVVRMTRALRPDGIEWPFAPDGKPSNRLELLTAVNGLDHQKAHDALSDVDATIAVARLIQQKQPKLFDYLLQMRDKKKVAELVNDNQPFVYSSGKYSAECEKTTVVMRLADHPKKQGALVYDLRHDPEQFIALRPDELAERWKYQREPDPAKPRLPVKVLQFNRCPAVAPTSVLDAPTRERLKIDMAAIKRHAALVQTHPEFIENLLAALSNMDEQFQGRLLSDESDVDAQMYDGFFAEGDKTKMRLVRAASAADLSSLEVAFKDQRLEALLPLYKARNFPATLSDEERQAWERFRERKLLGGKQSSRLAKYFNRLAELANSPGLSGEKQFILEELQLYGQSIMPLQDM
jgi:exodeoxyribonuclease-1